MKLTERAINYLSKLERIKEFNLDRERTIEYCRKQNFPLSEVLLDVQTNYSGYKLTIKNDSSHGFLLRLFAEYDYVENREIEHYYFGESFVLVFGEHDSAPFQFYITNSGELCTLGHQEGETPNIICSSIEKYIEQYALLDKLAADKNDPAYYNIPDSEGLLKLLEKDFNKIIECSDKYSQWFTNGLLTIDIGTWLDKPEFYLHVFGKDKESCDDFISLLKQQKMIE